MVLGNRHHISKFDLPRLAASGMTGLINSGLNLVQALFYNRSIGRTVVPEPPLFIIGHWRSGTTLLHQLLALDPKHDFPTNYACFCPCHFLLTERLLGNDFNGLLPPTRGFDSTGLTSEQPQEDEFALLALGAPSPYEVIAAPSGLTILERIEREMSDPCLARHWNDRFVWFTRALTGRGKGRRLVLKSPLHSFRIPRLRALYPGAKFIYLTRSPFEVVPSTLSMWKFLFHHHALIGDPTVPLEDDAIDLVVALRRAVQRDRQGLPPEQFCQLAFHRLIEDPAGQLQRIYGQLELGPFDLGSPGTFHALAAIGHQRRNRYEMSEALHQKIAARCTEPMGEVATEE
jgi:omega-hydroxy-beta-dihydromenaquinone-9 sulfotransferase